jgi:two-component system sensor kinase FixL
MLTADADRSRNARKTEAESATRANSEEILRESEAKLRGILETAVDGIITVNESGIVESLNPAAERIFGYAAHEVIGQNVKVLMPSPYREAHDGYIENYLKTGYKKIIGIGREVTGLRKDGSTFPMHISVSEVDLGPRRLFTGLVRDLSEQKKLEKQVLQVERLATIGKMAAKVAHEIRNPLSSISLNAELLQDELTGYAADDTAEAQALLKAMIAEIDRVTSLTEEYLQFSRLPESQPVRDDINRVVKETVEFFCPQARQKKIRVESRIAAETWPVRFDPVQIRRALLNIMRNAVEAMSKGGALQVATERHEREVVIHLADDGIGIAPEEIEKIFDPFFTTKDFGTGLGLAIVQQIIEEHHGRIDCQSRLGQGTRFSIFLPLDQTV